MFSASFHGENELWVLDGSVENSTSAVLHDSHLSCALVLIRVTPPDIAFNFLETFDILRIQVSSSNPFLNRRPIPRERETPFE